MASAIATVVAAVVIPKTSVAIIVGALGVGMVVWSLRLKWGVGLALRDFRNASTPPRRAFVVLLHDVNPRAVRPLLAIWSTKPVAGERLPKPDIVYRCDDELRTSRDIRETWWSMRLGPTSVLARHPSLDGSPPMLGSPCRTVARCSAVGMSRR